MTAPTRLGDGDDDLERLEDIRSPRPAGDGLSWGERLALLCALWLVLAGVVAVLCALVTP